MVAIKDFEMPKDCDSCPFYDYHNDAEDTDMSKDRLEILLYIV